MTFIAPAHRADTARIPSFLFGRKAVKSKGRAMVGDEAGARQALGTDGLMPGATLVGSSIEHLARIALG